MQGLEQDLRALSREEFEPALSVHHFDPAEVLQDDVEDEGEDLPVPFSF